MGRGRVLVVDDEVNFRYFLNMLFTRNGYEAKTARNGEEALTVLQSWMPDCITLDMMMPERSGLSLYEKLCQHTTWKNIPVVVLSAVPVYVREHLLEIMKISAGPLPEPAVCLEKPAAPEAILEAVAEALNGATKHDGGSYGQENSDH